VQSLDDTVHLDHLLVLQNVLTGLCCTVYSQVNSVQCNHRLVLYSAMTG